VEIIEGVQAGDWVVVSGMQRLKKDEKDQIVRVEKYAEADPASEHKNERESIAIAPSGEHRPARHSE
jgi:hypothetical protein